MGLPSYASLAPGNSSASSGINQPVRRETWDEERARLISYLRDPPQEPLEAARDTALDVLDEKDLEGPSRRFRIQRIK